MKKIKNSIKKLSNTFDYFKLYKNSILKNKDVFILGSAPSPNLKLYSEDKVLITCNASAASAKKNNLKSPLITIIDNELTDPAIATVKPSRSVIIDNKMLKDIDLGNLISVQSNFSKGGPPDILQARFNQLTKININLRRLILQRTLQVSWFENEDLSLASTGGFAIAFCAFMRARSITFEGFNLFQGQNNNLRHFYDSNNSNGITQKKLNTKAHSLADCLIVGLLSAQGIKLNTSEIDFFPMLNNWGNPIFKYKKE